MKDFDSVRQIRTERDRDFVIGGEHFRARASVRPEVLMPFSEISRDTPGDVVLATIDQLVLDTIEPTDDAHARWTALRTRDDDTTVTLGDLQELAEWLTEVHTGRPTEQPGDSFSGPGSTGTTSTDTSSSPGTPEA